MDNKKKSKKHQISYKDNIRDEQISDYVDKMKLTIGISDYLKLLVEQDMKVKGEWKYY